MALMLKLKGSLEEKKSRHKKEKSSQELNY